MQESWVWTSEENASQRGTELTSRVKDEARAQHWARISGGGRASRPSGLVLSRSLGDCRQLHFHCQLQKKVGAAGLCPKP